MLMEITFSIIATVYNWPHMCFRDMFNLLPTGTSKDFESNRDSILAIVSRLCQNNNNRFECTFKSLLWQHILSHNIEETGYWNNPTWISVNEGRNVYLHFCSSFLTNANSAGLLHLDFRYTADKLKLVGKPSTYFDSKGINITKCVSKIKRINWFIDKCNDVLFTSDISVAESA